MPYSLQKLGPNWQKALLHGLATRPGIAVSDKDDSNTSKKEVCDCCSNAIYKELAPLCQNSKELEFLGFGFPLYYVFVKYCIILLMITISSYNAIALYLAISYNTEFCNSPEAALQESSASICDSWFVFFSRTQKNVSDIQRILRAVSYAIHLVVLLYVRDLITKTEAYYDQRTCSLSDYSVLMTGLPNKSGVRNRLTRLLREAFDMPYKAAQIIFLPCYDRFYELMEEQTNLIQLQKKYLKNPEKFKTELEETINKQAENEEAIREECEKQLKSEQEDETVTERLIFSCLTEDEKQKIVEAFEGFSEQKIREYLEVEPNQICNIKMGEAPEPKEILWENINYDENKRVIRMVFGWILTIIFLGSVTAVFFFLLSAKTEMLLQVINSRSESMHQNVIILVYLAIVSVIVFNKVVMGAVLHHICHIELHPTETKLEFHFALKYSVGMFFTTALMTLAVEDIRFHNFYLHEYGVIEEQSIMFFMNAYFVPFFWLVNPLQIYKIVKRYFNFERNDLTQSEANKLMEDTPYAIGKRYAEIIETMWFTFLYTTLIPFGALMALLGLVLYYWVDKYNLLRRSSLNSNISGELSLFSMKLLDVTLLAKPIGEIIFDSQIRDSVTPDSYVYAAIAIVYLLIPIDSILKFIHDEKFKLEAKHYNQVVATFKESYTTLHPIFSTQVSGERKSTSSDQSDFMRAAVETDLKYRAKKTGENCFEDIEDEKLNSIKPFSFIVKHKNQGGEGNTSNIQMNGQLGDLEGKTANHINLNEAERRRNNRKYRAYRDRYQP